MTRETAHPIVCIGLDSFDKDLVIDWAKSGDLPNIASLLGGSAWGSVTGLAGVNAGSGWPTFNTGLLPGHHGQPFGLDRFDPATYEDKVPLTESDVKWRTFWEIFGAAGRNCVVFDPGVYSPANIERTNGVILNDWATHDQPINGTFWARPPYLADEIKQKFGLDTIGRCDDTLRDSDEALSSFVDALIERAQRKTEITLYLMDTIKDWDLFFVTYHEPHCVGHHCWHLHDPTHPRHDPDLARKIGDPLFRVYSQLDASIGQIISHVKDDEPYIFVYSNEGIGPHYTGTNFMDEMLARIEHHTYRSTRVGKKQSVHAGARAVWRLIPPTVRESLGSVHRIGKRYFLDKEHRRYFEIVCSNQTAGIRLNVKGRERHGLIEPGAEYDRVCNQLIEDLSTFKNRDTGQDLFDSIKKTSELYHGDFLNSFPDILAMWNRSSPIEGVFSPKFGVLENQRTYKRSGDHVPEGFFVAFGPGIEPRVLNHGVSPTDFAPTFAHLLGLNQSDFDGEIISPLAEREP